MKKHAACLLLITVVSIGSIFIQTSPVSAWTVRVHNTTNEAVAVDIFVNKLFLNSAVTVYNLVSPGETAVFETGGWCPSGISGLLYYRTGGLPMQSHSCLGHDVGSDGFTACCWNVNFKIVRKKGEGNIIEAYDYGFSLE